MSEAERAVSQIVDEVLGRAVPLDDDLFDHGATSLSFVRILAQINNRLGVLVPAAELDAATPRALASYAVTDRIGV
jgi:acyl carrier protein